jgi:gamma-glutamyltranspeptidase / glutathione hydrolase / leukotriene-C4 hydrolase
MKRVTAISTAVLLTFVISLGVFLWIAYRFGLQPDDNVNDTTSTSSLPTTTQNPHLSSGAVATGSDECTDVAIGILQQGGSAVDAAICATLCQGVTTPQASGMGGGFLATVFIKEKNSVETLNAREVAPLSAHRDLFKNGESSSEGGLSIAVPTEVKGLWELHQKYGKLSWAEVLEPVIGVAESGFKVTNYLAAVLEARKDKIIALDGFR